MLQLIKNNFKKKYIVKIPENFQIIYCNTKNIIILFKNGQKKAIKLEVKIILIYEKNLIVVTDIPHLVGVKSSKKVQGMTVALIKQKLVEMSYTLFTKLKLVGVGYRVFSYQKLKNQVYFKLGYSHLVYFSVPLNLSLFCYKFTKIFIYGNTSYNLLTQVASQIRSCKVPEIYKGKGILHYQEKIKLKRGKKI